jgi:hypothetical protein
MNLSFAFIFFFWTRFDFRFSFVPLVLESIDLPPFSILFSVSVGSSGIKNSKSFKVFDVLGLLLGSLIGSSLCIYGSIGLADAEAIAVEKAFQSKELPKRNEELVQSADTLLKTHGGRSCTVVRRLRFYVIVVLAFYFSL